MYRHLVGLIGALLSLIVGAACAPATHSASTGSAGGAPASTAAPSTPRPATAAPATAAAPATSAPSANTPPRTVKVTVGVLGTTSDGPMFVGYERGYFKEQGIEVEFVPFATSTEMIAPLSTDQL